MIPEATSAVAHGANSSAGQPAKDEEQGLISISQWLLDTKENYGNTDMIDLTKTDTIYKRKLRTISLKVNESSECTCGQNQPVIHAPEDAYEVLRSIFTTLDDHQEHMVMLVMNQANKITGYKIISSGGQISTVVDPKVVFRSALLLGARSILLAHNHPSGDPTPSREDLALTVQMVAAGSLMDVTVQDHIIYTPSRFTSIRALNEDVFSTSHFISRSR